MSTPSRPRVNRDHESPPRHQRRAALEAAPIGASLEARIAAWRSEIDRELDRLLPPEGAPPRPLHAAMRYAVFAGGKRLRPILTMAAAEAAGGDLRSCLPCACAIEMIHTYSLVHDDLPAMDDDSLRRGKPTTHLVFGEALAILAGDALLTRAMEILATEPCGEMFAPSRGRVVALVAGAAGAAGMIGGQADDLEAAGMDGGRAKVQEAAAGARVTSGQREDEAEKLVSIHRRKTGALITASVLVGALLAGADAGRVERLRRYGEALGLAFQIVDDLLDVESTTAALGKSAGKDIRDTKLTFPAVLGLEESRRRAGDLCRAARREADALGPPAATLSSLAELVISRKS